MNYQQTIEYLFAKLPMFSRIGSGAIKKGLTNTILLCNYLNNPQEKFKTVHVAGTNGKGSVSHMLASVFQAAGYKTGLYTSPHLKDFRERIRIIPKFNGWHRTGKCHQSAPSQNGRLKRCDITEPGNDFR